METAGLLRPLVMCLAALTASAAPAAAQTSLMVYGGLTEAEAVIEALEPSATSSTRTGLHAGAAVRLPLLGLIGLRLDGSYSEKGVSLNVAEGPVTANIDVRMPYVEFTPAITVGTRFVYAFAGPWGAYRTGCEATLSIQSQTQTDDCDEAGLEIESLDFGYAVGAGAGIDIAGNWSIGVEASVSRGLSDIDADSEGSDRNNAAQVRAFLSLPLG